MAQTAWFQRQKIVERLEISAFFNLIIGKVTKKFYGCKTQEICRLDGVD